MENKECRLQDARGTAFAILLKLERQHSNSTQLLQEGLSAIKDERERKLATELVLGVLRWRGRLLYLVSKFSKPPDKKLDLQVRVILMLGAYQLLYTRIRPHAVINETVRLCKRAKVTSATSFVNGVLRNMQRNLSLLPEPQGDEAAVLACRLSHPEWLVRRWIDRFGLERTTNVLVESNQPPVTHLRINTLLSDPAAVRARLQTEGIRLESTAFGPAVFAVLSGAPQRTKSFAEGEFYIQDPASEVLGEMADPKPGGRVLEVAAAPGGKTIQFAMRMNDQGLIISTDPDLKRMNRWQENIRRMKIASAYGVVCDGRFPAVEGLFDLVAVDAPCSSLGVIRRHPEIKWWLRPEDLSGFRTRQLQILDACANNVRDHGEMIYSVCSFEPEETIEVKNGFLAAHPEFAEVESRTLFPHIDGTDGFFIAKFRKTNHGVTETRSQSTELRKKSAV